MRSGIGNSASDPVFVAVTSGGGGGGGGDASAANQLTEIDRLTTLATAANKPTAGANLSGSVTTTSGDFNLPADATRKPGDVQGQNLGTVNIGFNEFNATAAIGSAGTWTVVPGQTFAITTSNRINFVAASGTAAVTIVKIV